MNVVIQMSAIFFLELTFESYYNIDDYGYLICPQNDIDSIIFIDFFYSWKSFSNILEAI